MCLDLLDVIAQGIDKHHQSQLFPVEIDHTVFFDNNS
jgi:hypothetical protein